MKTEKVVHQNGNYLKIFLPIQSSVLVGLSCLCRLSGWYQLHSNRRSEYGITTTIYS